MLDCSQQCFLYLNASPAVLLNEGLDQAPRRLLVLDVAEHSQQAFAFTNLQHRVGLKAVNNNFRKMSYLHNAIMSGNEEMVRIRYVCIRLYEKKDENQTFE